MTGSNSQSHMAFLSHGKGEITSQIENISFFTRLMASKLGGLVTSGGRRLSCYELFVYALSPQKSRYLFNLSKSWKPCTIQHQKQFILSLSLVFLL